MNYEKLEASFGPAKKGDMTAFSDLYAELTPSIYFSAQRMLHNDADAQDIAHETILAVYLHMHKIKNINVLVSYTKQTVYRKCLNFLRGQKHISDMADDALYAHLDQNIHKEFLPEEICESQESKELLLRKLDELAPEYRAVLMMFYFDEMSSKEIAKTLDISDTLVRRRLSRARQSLRGKWEGTKEVPLLAVPVLTRVLSEQAEKIWSEALSGEIWASFCAESAVASQSAALAAKVAQRVAFQTVLTKGVAATAAVTAVTGGAILNFFAKESPVEEPPAELVTILEEPEAPFVEAPELLILPSPDAEDEIPPLTSDLDILLPAEPEETAAAVSSTPQIEEGEEPAEAPEPEPEPVPEPLELHFAQNGMSVPVGHTLTAEEILAYAAPQCGQTQADFRVELLQRVNVEVSGEYPVFIFAQTEQEEIYRAFQINVTEQEVVQENKTFFEENQDEDE